MRVAWLALVACGASLVACSGHSVPATDAGAAAPRDGGDLAPRCESSGMGCIEARSVSESAIGASARVERVYGVVGDTSGASVVVAVRTDDEGYERRLLRWDSAGAELPTVSFGPQLMFNGVTSGALVRDLDGSLLVAWRAFEFDAAGRALGVVTHRARATDGRVEVLEPTLRTALGGDYTLRVELVRMGAGVALVAAGPTGVRVLFPGTTDAVGLADGAGPVRSLAAIAVDDRRVGIAWTENVDLGVSNIRIAIVASGEGVVAERALRTTIDDVDLSGRAVALGVHDGQLIVAHFEQDEASLFDSRIRIDYFDGALARATPSRWVSGWGGLTPTDLAISNLAGRAVLLWRALDTRYSAPTLHATFLSPDVCGFGVGSPAVVLAAGDATAGELAIDATASAIWVATRNSGGVTTRQLTPCATGE